MNSPVYGTDPIERRGSLPIIAEGQGEHGVNRLVQPHGGGPSALAEGAVFGHPGSDERMCELKEDRA